MSNYDYLVIGAGITGSALSYELAKKGFKVLLLEKDANLDNATIYSYGGIAYWSGTTELTRKLCEESLELHQNLSQELDIDTEFREVDLLLTIPRQNNSENVLSNYQQFARKPQLLNVQETCELEPLLNANNIAGSLRFTHGHINPQKTNLGYQKAFQRLGGEIQFEEAITLLKEGNKIQGIITNNNTYYAENTVICAGGLTRKLLQENGIKIPLYFTHAQLIKTPPTDIKLLTVIMSANLERLVMEGEFTQSKNEQLWENPSTNLLTSVMETGGVQFLDGSICLGQISQIITNPNVKIDAVASELEIRKNMADLLPSLANLSGTWHNCLVAFSKEYFLVGKIANFEGIYLFSGFTSPLVYVPPLARHFANYFTGENQLSLPFVVGL